MPDDESQLPELWLSAARRAEVDRALRDIHADAARAIAERAPACWASGRCCGFEKAGHLLYVTGLETAWTIAALDHTLSRDALDEARRRGGCPFQVANLCGVHPIRPLGCRVYFCDKSAQAWQHELSERLLADVRALHDRFDIEYRYGEWRAMLARFAV
jgi:Fe-S-cluster containining protein